jgi:hypothetical protein
MVNSESSQSLSSTRHSQLSSHYSQLQSLHQLRVDFSPHQCDRHRKQSGERSLSTEDNSDPFRCHSRRGTRLISSLNLCTRSEQHLDHFNTTKLTGTAERCLAQLRMDQPQSADNKEQNLQNSKLQFLHQLPGAEESSGHS